MSGSTSPQRPLTLISAKWSALVGPMFRMAIGNFLSLAANKNLYPEYTFETRERQLKKDTKELYSLEVTLHEEYL